MERLLEVKQGINLAGYTTLGIGGNARFFVRAETETQVAEAVKFAETSSLKLFVLGGGSNVLIADHGFRGLVLKIALKGIVRDADEPARVTAQAGEKWDRFVSFCVKNRFAGVECLSGIPGLVGGTPVQNVGAYGQEVSETIVSVRCFDRTTKEFITLSNSDCGFSYRTSIFNTTERDRYIVISVTFSLIKDGRPKVEYPELKQAIENSLVAQWREDSGQEDPFLGEVREQVLKIRRAKSMVIDPEDANSKSAGSFFKNPVVDHAKFESLRMIHENIPFFEFGAKFKIPAAWLIENAGFKKGFESGNAGISTKHTLALINRGGATATDMIALKGQIEKTVSEKFGINLQPEPVFVGF